MADRLTAGQLRMPTTLATRAPAKVNLTLHVHGRRPDGYHELESLVVFAGAADHLTLEPGDRLSLLVDGPTAALSGPPGDNLVIRAATALRERVPGLRTGTFRLTKRLPAAAGIGGGSSDAAAALRLLARANDLAPAHPAIREAARATGADVPVCLDPRARTMRGVGEQVGPPIAVPALFGILVNPRVAVPTPAVFRRLGLQPGDALPNPPHPDIGNGLTRDIFVDAVRGARNDLEPPAVALEPAIAGALRLIGATEGCRLARMSGSGATTFGLYDDCRAAAAAARTIRTAEPGWWVKATTFR